jgi:hypothetical protein
VAQLTFAARWCSVSRNKGILHLGARGHQEAPVRQWRGASRAYRDRWSRWPRTVASQWSECHAGV